MLVPWFSVWTTSRIIWCDWWNTVKRPKQKGVHSFKCVSSRSYVFIK